MTSAFNASFSFLGKAVSSINDFYKEINPATLSGVIDIIVVKQYDESLMCSPFHVRFGKLKLLMPSEKIVEISVNGIPQDHLLMKLGDAAFFVVENSNSTTIPKEYLTSPIPSPLPSDTFVEPLNLDGNLQVEDDYVSAYGSEPELSQGNMVNNLDYDKNLDFYSEIEKKTNDTEANLYTSTPENSFLIHPDFLQNITETSVIEIPDKENDHSFNELSDVVNDLLLSSPIPSKRDNTASVSLIPDAPLVPISPLIPFNTQPSYSNKNPNTPSFMTNQQTSISINPISPQLRDKNRAVHPYPLSDTEVDITISTIDVSRISQKPLSDTEVDISYFKNQSSNIQSSHDPSWSWQWGGLPTKSSSLDQKETISDPLITKPDSKPIRISLCGNKKFPSLTDSEISNEFTNSEVTFDEFWTNPSAFLNNPNLIFLIGTRFMSWEHAAPHIVSFCAFNRFGSLIDLPITGSKADIPKTKSYFTSWWSNSSNQSGLGIVSLPQESEVPITKNLGDSDLKRNKENKETTPIDIKIKNSSPVQPQTPTPTQKTPLTKSNKSSYMKSLRPTSDQLKSFNLKYGVNTITFSVRSQLQGKASCSAKIFLYDCKEKIVISDIDGTITKSDALGHLFTMVGKDWTHTGVANLYSKIFKNGAIGQAESTRDYLKKVEQGTYQLPEGPVIMSPDRLLRALHREVIRRRPEEFKIACLKDIQALFGGIDVFYAGFGNRITDALSYRSVNIPPSRIFTIDSSGEVRLMLLPSYKSTYIKLMDLVDQMFPPVDAPKLIVDFNDWNYWKQPLPDITVSVPNPDNDNEDNESDEPENDMDEMSSELINVV